MKQNQKNQLFSEVSADDIKTNIHQLIGSNVNKRQLIVTNPNGLLKLESKQQTNDIFFLLFSIFVIHGRTMIKSIQKIGVKLAGKTTTVTQVKNVSDITINAWLIEASALMR